MLFLWQAPKMQLNLGCAQSWRIVMWMLYICSKCQWSWPHKFSATQLLREYLSTHGEVHFSLTMSSQLCSTLFVNNLSDALNRCFATDGLRIGCKDSWEQEVVRGDIHKDLFLTQSTAEGLRVTLKSVQELSAFLLKESDFTYVLSAIMNWDP